MNIEEEIVKKLTKLNYHIATAESCTGGLVAATLINVSDVSSVLDLSLVTYANKEKVRFLRVKEETIKNFGVVSEEVAREMAQGLQKISGAEVALSTSGIAGPSGGTPKKPVGMVCFGIAIKDKVYTYTKYFGNIGRQEVRGAAVSFILNTLNDLLNI